MTRANLCKLEALGVTARPPTSVCRQTRKGRTPRRGPMRLTLCAPMAARGPAPKPRRPSWRMWPARCRPRQPPTRWSETWVRRAAVPNVPSASTSAASRQWSCRLRRPTHPDYALPPPRHHPSSGGRRRKPRTFGPPRRVPSGAVAAAAREAGESTRRRGDGMVRPCGGAARRRPQRRRLRGQHSQGRRGLVRSTASLGAAGYTSRGRSAQNR